MSINFDFSANVIPLIVKEINRADAYIRIAIFQLHNEEVIQALAQKLPTVKVEIFTLPFDSINPDIRPKVEPRLKQLQDKGAIFYFDKWNIGDPGRTTTAVGRWYSFHGKFIVTNRTAIALSANLTEDKEIDAVITFNDSERIKEFNCQFNRLIQLFVEKEGLVDGSIKKTIITSKQELRATIFELPKNIGQEHVNHWIREYPLEVCSSEQQITEKLYLAPFDCIGRQILVNLVNEAEKFVYLSTETFTDTDFSDFLVATSVNKKIEIKILTGGTSMDFTDRMENMLRDLLAHNVEVRVTDEELHAKLLVTDKALAVSSINLNKINLGFSAGKGYWRENTESVFVCKQPEILSSAKEKFLSVYNQGHDIRNRLIAKIDVNIRRSLSMVFKLKSSPAARRLIANFILEKQLENKQLLTKIGKITQKLMQHANRDKVEIQDVVSALILYYLSERKQDLRSITENITFVDPTINVSAAINSLEFSGFIEREGDYFKINLTSLF